VACIDANFDGMCQLYFAAYQGSIYVYRPRKAPHLLRREPDLILKPPRMPVSRVIKGYTDHCHGHQVNHLMVGQLGNLEILLMCFDDGDVVAYYTHHIAEYVREYIARMLRAAPHTQAGLASSPEPGPFFHDSVGKSAWGLAIHAKSRLIAISSNLAEVTVFAFALQNSRSTPQLSAETEINWPPNGVWDGPRACMLESLMRSRDRSWRIVLPLPTTGSNVPSISFFDDKDGNAECVVAADILRQLWMLRIWKVDPSNVLQLHTGVAPQLNNGWGCMVLHSSDFGIRTTTLSDTTGLVNVDDLQQGICPPAEAEAEAEAKSNFIMADISRGLLSVWDNVPEQITRSQLAVSAQMARDNLSQELCHIHRSARMGGLILTADDIDDGAHGAQEGPAQSPGALHEPAAAVAVPSLPLYSSMGHVSSHLHSPFYVELPPRAAINLPTSRSVKGSLEEAHAFRNSMTVVPGIQRTYPHLEGAGLLCFARASHHRQAHLQPVRWNGKGEPIKKSMTTAARELHDLFEANRHIRILHTDNRHVRLLSLCTDIDPSVTCRSVLFPYNPHKRRVPWDLQENGIGGAGISLLCRIPELSLVILGAAYGRVAVLSLTRPATNVLECASPIRKSFRVEAILPRMSDEERDVRPYAALHGIAVSPVLNSAADSMLLQRPDKRPTRWRLLLHYMDHTILEYEIERPEGQSDLLIL
jgi:hypothetical protein